MNTIDPPPRHFTRAEVIDMIGRLAREQLRGERPGTRLKHYITERCPEGRPVIVGREDEPCTVRTYHYTLYIGNQHLVLAVDKDGIEYTDQNKERVARTMLGRKALKLLLGEEKWPEPLPPPAQAPELAPDDRGQSLGWADTLQRRMERVS